MSVLHFFLCFLITSKAVGPAQKNIQRIELDDGIVDGDDNDDIPVCTKYVMSFVQNTSTISLYIKSHRLLDHSYQGHLCLFSSHLTPLSLLYGIGTSGSFRFKKQGQICKVKKTEANMQLELKKG